MLYTEDPLPHFQAVSKVRHYLVTCVALFAKSSENSGTHTTPRWKCVEDEQCVWSVPGSREQI